ncbi:MAG: cupin domain-containing protein [Rhodanobacteraceae bacterium]|nr:cupin domain-containing protein [Rhodanobacteraceae bacterium]
MPAIRATDLPARTGSLYPEPFRSRVLPREKRALGDAFGLTAFGVNLTVLHPGAESSMRHWHTHEEELIYILDGEVVLVTDAGEQVLSPGMVVGFRAGDPDAHQLVNRSDRPATYLEVGGRDPRDAASYPDVDLAARQSPEGKWIFLHKDGSAY